MSSLREKAWLSEAAFMSVCFTIFRETRWRGPRGYNFLYAYYCVHCAHIIITCHLPKRGVRPNPLEPPLATGLLVMFHFVQST